MLSWTESTRHYKWAAFGKQNSVVNQTLEQDDVRYQHHLEHRGHANRQLFLVFWVILSAVIFGIASQRVCKWWRRRR